MVRYRFWEDAWEIKSSHQSRLEGIFFLPPPSPYDFPGKIPDPSILVFWISLLFSFSDFPCFFGSFFPFFSKDFRGSAKRRTLFFPGFPLHFSKKTRVGWSGISKSVVPVNFSPYQTIRGDPVLGYF